MLVFRPLGKRVSSLRVWAVRNNVKKDFELRGAIVYRYDKRNSSPQQKIAMQKVKCR